MTLPLFRTLPIIPPKNPRLPAAPVEYDRIYVDTLTSILRQYFNTIDNFAQPFTDNYGGAYLRFPNGAFHQDGYTTLTAAIPNPISTAAIQVASTNGFLSSGALLIGTELIKYTGKTATTFTGITRSAYGSSGSSHAIGDYVSEAQPVPSATTSAALALTTTDASNQIAIDTIDNTKVNFSVSGYYNIQFSAQMLSFDGTIDNVTFWFRQNGTDVANSAGIVSIPAIHGGVAGAAIVSWNIVLPINAGQYIQLLFASTTGNTVCSTYPPATAPTRPASPSIILTATFVSALYT
jgi:hypothetical protein